MSTKIEIVVCQQRIKEIGQRINFQFLLPKDAKRIVGIEHSTRRVSGTLISGFTLLPADGFVYLKDKLIGKLTLQTPGVEGIFYQNDLYEQKNIAYGEPLTNVWLMPTWVMATRRDPIEINICDGLTFIEGYYEDYWGQLEYTNLEYQLSIYLWVELE